MLQFSSPINFAFVIPVHLPASFFLLQNLDAFNIDFNIILPFKYRNPKCSLFK
jgi:hypothetical protein